MDYSTPGFPVFHHLPKFSQVHVHSISDAIQPSPLFCLQSFQQQGLFQLVSYSHQMTEILELQHQSFQHVFKVYFPEDWLVWSPCCPRDFQESSPALQFEGINSLVLYLLYSPALTIICDHREDHSLDYIELCQQSNVSAFSTLSSFVIAFLPRSNCLLISWLQSSPTVILEPKKRKSVTTSTFPPSICHEVKGPDIMILAFFFFFNI